MLDTLWWNNDDFYFLPGSINDVGYDANNNDPFRFNYPSIASCGRLQFRHHFFGFISCPLKHGQDFMCHVFHRYFSITFCWPLTFTSLYITFVCMKFLSITLNFSSKEDLVDKVLEHVADGFSRTSFTVWAKHSEDRDLKKWKQEWQVTRNLASPRIMRIPHQIITYINHSFSSLNLFNFQTANLQVSTFIHFEI